MKNMGARRSRMQESESIMDGMVEDLLQVRDLIVWASDGGSTSEDVAAIAGSMAALRDSLFYNANSKDQEGRHLFSGTMTATAAIGYDNTQPVGSRYSFQGNLAEQKVVVGNEVTETANVTMQEMADLLNRMDAAVGALQTPGASSNDPAVRALVVGALNGTDDVINAVNTKIATLGGAQVRLSTLETNHANVSLSNQQAMITLGQLDYGDAAVKLNGYTTAVQATQKAYAKVSQLSLFDAL